MTEESVAVIDIEDAFVLHRGRNADVAALRGMTLRVDRGERVVIRGPSGSGKSTLVAALTGEVRVSAGRVRLFGHDLAQLDRGAVTELHAAHIGIVSQRSGRDLIDEFDCAGNVALQARIGGLRRNPARLAALDTLERLGLAHLARRLPSSLSGGERQRVAVAAALAHGPTLVVADEPTGELDAASADEVYSFLADYADRSGAALMVVTHDVRAEHVATRVLTINDGRLSEEKVGDVSSLVVDGRGWLRLPDELRVEAGIAGRADVSHVDGHIRLTPTDSIAPPASDGGERPESVLGDVLAQLDDVEIDIDTITIGPVTMTLRRGELTVLTGRSGSGKTSTLSVVLGLREPQRGTVTRGAGTSACATQTPAFADQQGVTANIDLVRAIRSLPPLDSSRTGLDELGIGGLVDRPAGALSGGERQRLAIARALASSADLVVLDEPTSQLDRATARRAASVMRRVASGGSCVVCASHDPELIALADQVIDLAPAGYLPVATGGC